MTRARRQGARAAARAFRLGAVRRLARRPRRGVRGARSTARVVWPPRGDKGFGYDPMFLPDGHDPHLRRDAGRGEARPAAARPRPVAPRPRLPQARGGLLAQALIQRRPSASTCTGRSACRSARIATSTATSATPRSTRRVSCARSKPRSPRPPRACPGAHGLEHLPRRRHALADAARDRRRHPRHHRPALARRAATPR